MPFYPNIFAFWAAIRAVFLYKGLFFFHWRQFRPAYHFLAAVIEEVGWRGYGEDSVASYFSWFTESIIFGLVWALWHLPLFWINGTYHYGLRELGIGYTINFLISVMPMGFLTTWVYVKNNRSMLACIIFHLFVNVMQEKIAMTPETKCVETIVIFVVAVLIVTTNKKVFLTMV